MHLSEGFSEKVLISGVIGAYNQSKKKVQNKLCTM